MSWPLLAAAALVQTAPSSTAPAADSPDSVQRPAWPPREGVVVEFDMVPTVHFDLNSSRIRPEDRTVLDRAATTFVARRLEGIEIAGHADASGSATYNRRLSRRRAAIVAAYLARRGVPGRAITLRASGEARLLVDTADDRQNPQNRRAEIYFHPLPVP